MISHTAFSDIRPVTLDPQAYEAAIAALFDRRPEIMIPGLDRITALAAELGDPQLAYPAVQITGTNGKTSMARMVTALLVACGKRVGTYTSPHLQDVRERIRLDAVPVSPETLFVALQVVVDHASQVEQQRQELVTFFETLTALAYTVFAEARVDVGVLEVGMGGRWDATNLVDGRVGIIGTVGLDHVELGATVEEVAWEKAGIIKPAAQVVVARQLPAAMAVIRQVAAAQGAVLLTEDRDFGVMSRSTTRSGQEVAIYTPSGEYTFELPLAGAHQAQNAACAVMAAEAYLGDALDRDLVVRACAGVRSPGRMESFPRAGRPTVMLDGAHNPDGARALADALASDCAKGRCIVVLGVLGDKDAAGIATALAPVADEMVITNPQSVRAGSLDRLLDALPASCRKVHSATDVPAALALADEVANSSDTIVVTGSLYTVGEARSLLQAPIG